MAKLNGRQILIAYSGATVSAVTTGLVGGVLWNEFGGRVPLKIAILGTWFVVVGVPSLAVSMDALRRVLGIKGAPSVTANQPGGVRSRPVKINLPTGPVTEFLTILPGRSSKTDGFVRLPDSWTVEINGVRNTVTEAELSTFLTKVWRRQRSGFSGLSRTYWMREHRPRLRRQEYEARLTILLGVGGLIVDRGERRSGRLILPPGLSIKAVYGQFSLG